jgi:hypothetical protein
MFSRADEYRRLGIRARQQAGEATDQRLRCAFDEVADNWFSLAEQGGMAEPERDAGYAATAR